MSDSKEAHRKLLEAERLKTAAEKAHMESRSSIVMRSPLQKSQVQGAPLTEEARLEMAKKLGLPRPEVSPPLLERIASSLNPKSPHLIGKETEALASFLLTPSKQPPAKRQTSVQPEMVQLMTAELEAAECARHIKNPSARGLASYRDEEDVAKGAERYYGKDHEKAAGDFEKVISSKHSSPEAQFGEAKSCSARSLASDTAKTYSKYKAKFDKPGANRSMDKTLTGKESVNVVPFDSGERRQLEQDAHAFDGKDPAQLEALQEKSKRQLARRLAEDRRNAQFSARRRDEEKWAKKLEDPKFDLGEDPLDIHGITRTGVRRRADNQTISQMSDDTFLQGVVRYRQIDSMSRISKTSRDDAGMRLANMIVFEPRPKDIDLDKDIWTQIETIFMSMDKVKSKSIRQAQKLVKQALAEHRVAMLNFKEGADHPRLVDAVQLLRMVYEDCQNAPFIADLAMRYGFKEVGPAALDYKEFMVREVKALATEAEIFREWVVDVLHGQIMIDEGDITEAADYAIKKFQFDTGKHDRVRLKQSQIDYEDSEEDEDREVEQTVARKVHPPAAPVSAPNTQPRGNSPDAEKGRDASLGTLQPRQEAQAGSTRASTPLPGRTDVPLELDVSGLSNPLLNTEEGKRRGEEIKDFLASNAKPEKQKTAEAVKDAPVREDERPPPPVEAVVTVANKEPQMVPAQPKAGAATSGLKEVHGVKPKNVPPQAKDQKDLGPELVTGSNAWNDPIIQQIQKLVNADVASRKAKQANKRKDSANKSRSKQNPAQGKVPTSVADKLPEPQGAQAMSDLRPQGWRESNPKYISYQYLKNMAGLAGPDAQKYANQAEILRVEMELEVAERERYRLQAISKRDDSLEERIRKMKLTLEEFKAHNSKLQAELTPRVALNPYLSVPPPTTVPASLRTTTVKPTTTSAPITTATSVSDTAPKPSAPQVPVLDLQALAQQIAELLRPA